MPKATVLGGTLTPINDCYIIIPSEAQPGMPLYSFKEPEPEPDPDFITRRGHEPEPPPSWVISGLRTQAPTVIILNNLPDISDSKQAQYNDEPIMGRSSPLKTYSHSTSRKISMGLHFYVTKPGDLETNMDYLRALESAVYPRNGTAYDMPFLPPPICKLKCGPLLSSGYDICAVLLSYSVKFDTRVAWSEGLVPFKMDVDTEWEVVYKSSDLPSQQNILFTGR